MAGGRFRQLGRKEEDTELPAPAKLPPPEVNRGSTQSEKISKYISGLGSNLSPEVGQYLQQAQPCIQAVIRCGDEARSKTHTLLGHTLLSLPRPLARLQVLHVCVPAV